MAHQLTAQHEALIERIVATSRFSDPDEVLTEALRQMADRELQLNALRATLHIGIDEADRGEVDEWTPELRSRLRQEAVEMFRRGEQPDPDVLP